MRHSPASGAIIIIIIMLWTLKMHGMAQAVGELTQQGSPAFEAAMPILSQLLKAETAEREVRSTNYQLKAARFPTYRDLNGFDFDSSEISETLVRKLHYCELFATDLLSGIGVDGLIDEVAVVVKGAYGCPKCIFNGEIRVVHTLKPRYAYLDGLRGLAALNVAISHTVIAFDFAPYTGLVADAHGSWELPLSRMPFLTIFGGASASVSIFFILSGFVLTHSFLNTKLSIAALVIKRYIRLGLPIFIVCILSWAIDRSGNYYNQSTLLITKSSWAGWLLKNPADIVQALKEGVYEDLLGPWPGAASYDPALWTMPIEFLGSVLLILFVTAGREYLLRNRYLAGSIFTLAGIACNQLYLSLFFYGAALYLFDISSCMVVSRFARIAVWSLFAVGFTLATLPFSAVRSPFWDRLTALTPDPLLTPKFERIPGLVTFHDGSYFWHAVGAVLIIISIEIWPAARRVLSSPALIYLGRISYLLYLVHIPIVLSFGNWILLLLSNMLISYAIAASLAIVFSTGLSILLADVAERYVERPTIALASHAAQTLQKTTT